MLSIQQQARALMVRHRHLTKNRQRSMLNRAAASIETTERVSKSQEYYDCK
jgi:hypothetical protein